MTKLNQLQKLLEHEANNPLDFIKINTGEKDYCGKKDYLCNIKFFVNIYYCCFNEGRDEERKGSLEGNEQKLLNRIEIKEAVLIFAKYDTLEKFKTAFSREMHWINQTSTRLHRFRYLHVVIFNHIKETVEKAGGVEKYVDKHLQSLVKILPVNQQKIDLENMTKIEILEAIKKGTIEPANGMQMIDKIDSEEAERNRDKLCEFSGSGRDPERATRICSLTDDPKRIGDCCSCRVAAEWEEAYG